MLVMTPKEESELIEQWEARDSIATDDAIANPLQPVAIVKRGPGRPRKEQ